MLCNLKTKSDNQIANHTKEMKNSQKQEILFDDILKRHLHLDKYYQRTDTFLNLQT